MVASSFEKLPPLRHADRRRPSSQFAYCYRRSRRNGVDVEPQTLEGRVDRLEDRVTRLEELPQRIDELAGQILRMRADIGSELSAMRAEIRGGAEAVVTQLRGELR